MSPSAKSVLFQFRTAAKSNRPGPIYPSYQGREMTCQWIRHTLSGTLSPTSANGTLLLCLSIWVGPRSTSADLTASMLAPLTSSMLTPRFILAYLHGDSLYATLYPSIKGVIPRPRPYVPLTPQTCHRCGKLLVLTQSSEAAPDARTAQVVRVQ